MNTRTTLTNDRETTESGALSRPATKLLYWTDQQYAYHDANPIVPGRPERHSHKWVDEVCVLCGQTQ